jgi:calcium-binding protein CML
LARLSLEEQSLAALSLVSMQRKKASKRGGTRSPSPRPKKNTRGAPSDEDLHAMFKSVDMDGNGSINWFELKVALQKFGLSDSADRAKRMIAEADTDGDGEVDIDEFVSIMGAEVSSDEWVELSTSLKHQIIAAAQETYAKIVPVVELERTSSAYHFPNPEAPALCCSAFLADVAMMIITNVVTVVMLPVAPIYLLFTFVYGIYVTLAESTSIGMKHLVGIRRVDMAGQPLSPCNTIGLLVLQVIFTFMFFIEILACCCDVERRPLSFQVMGVRYASSSKSYSGPTPATHTGGSGGAGCFIVLVLVLFMSALFVAAASGLLQIFQIYMQCYAECAAAFGHGQGFCTFACDEAFRLALKRYL